MEILEKYSFLILAWIIFGALHSILASRVVKDSLGISDLNYRRLYNLQSILLLFAILLYGATLDPQYFLNNSKANKAIGLIFATFGYLLLKLAFKQISLSAFLGLKEETESKLITTGIYGRVRHPLYTASILVVIGFLIFSPNYTNVVHAICITIYIFIGAYFEEKKLISQFGDQYIEYKRNTPFIIPMVKNKDTN